MNWLQLACLSALFAGLVAIFARLGLKEMDATVATTARAAVMLGVLLLVLGVSGKLPELGKISGGTWLFIALAGISGALSWLFYFQALKVGDASKVACLDKLSTVVTVALAFAILKESLTIKVALGTALIVAGGILVAL